VANALVIISYDFWKRDQFSYILYAFCSLEGPDAATVCHRNAEAARTAGSDEFKHIDVTFFVFQVARIWREHGSWLLCSQIHRLSSSVRTPLFAMFDSHLQRMFLHLGRCIRLVGWLGISSTIIVEPVLTCSFTAS